MNRTLTILKYLPAVLCGLLVLAWVVSLFAKAEITFPFQNASGGWGCVSLRCNAGDIDLWYCPGVADPFGLGLTHQSLSIFPACFGHCGRIRFSDVTVYFVPIPALLTLLLPLAIGPFNRFRFPLWTWFAFTALVAVELWYYLT